MTPNRADATCLILASVALAVRRPARTRPGPRRPRRCSRRRPAPGCRASAPGGPRATARRRSSRDTTKRRAIARAASTSRAATRAARGRPTRKPSRTSAGVAPRARRGSVASAASTPSPGRRPRRAARAPSRSRGRVQVELAVAAEAREAGVREPVRPDGGRERAAPPRAAGAARGEVGEPRGARPRGGGREAAATTIAGQLERLEQLAADVDGDGEMPIRASTLRRPASSAASMLATALGRTAPPRRGSRPARAASSSSRRGCTARRRRPRPSRARGRRGYPRRRPRCRSGRAGRPRSSAVWTAPAARTDGTGSRAGSSSEAARRTGRRPRCPRGLRRARRRRVGRARPRARRRRSAAGHVASSRRTARCGARERPRTASSSPSRSTTTGRPSRTVSAPRGHAAQERRPAAELHLEVHDRAFALGVDRRVGDLGERLAEVVAGGTRDARPPGERRVVAHAPQRLVRVERHRPHVEAQLLGVQPEQVAQGGGRRGDALGRRGGGSVGGGVGRRHGNQGHCGAFCVGEDLARGVVQVAGGAGPTTSRRRP